MSRDVGDPGRRGLPVVRGTKAARDNCRKCKSWKAAGECRMKVGQELILFILRFAYIGRGNTTNDFFVKTLIYLHAVRTRSSLDSDYVDLLTVAY